mmetsp:Transcript_6706/g.27334  ORF Transcript_6706/g.27334 Transcript_6706/m.27334 type:complete len:210 (+) Transcript_6706:3238-3867(+)
MKQTVRPTELSLDALRAVAPRGQNGGNPSSSPPPIVPPVFLIVPPVARACALATLAASTTPRQITRPLSLGAPSSISAARTALLTPSAATSRSYGADTHASSSSSERSSDGASEARAKTATRRAKSTSRTPYPRVNSMRSGCLVAAVDAMASDSASLFTATVPLNCLDTAGAAPGRCRTFPTIRTTRSSGNVTPAPASAFIPLGESTTL